MTLPYKIALVCSAVVLVVAVVVRLGNPARPIEATGADGTSSSVDSEGPGTPASRSQASDPERADASRAARGASPESVARKPSTQAPSKPPPPLLALGSFAEPKPTPELVPGAMGDEEPPAPDLRPPPLSADVPTLTIGRAPDAPSPIPLVSAQPAAEGSSGIAPRVYTVRSGDTFEGIAVRELGAARRWVELARANPTVDPLRLRVGDELRLPRMIPIEEPATGLDAAELPPPVDPVTYVVRPGDSLSTIAARFYADSTRWRAIFNANRDRLESPHAVRAGMEIRIPPAIAAAPRSVPSE